MTIQRQLPREHRQTGDRLAERAADPEPPRGTWWRLPLTPHLARRLLIACMVAVLVASVALRTWASSPLWLDEAQTVAIAKLPLDQLFPALRQDGSPPLYYLILHAWMLAFGQGDLAVRWLSAVLSVATLPLMWGLARRLSGSRSVAWTALVLLAASPFAIRYATETRMYAFIVLLTVLGGYALLALRRPGPLPVLALACVVGALALTHYWALFLLGAVGGVLLWLAVRRRGDEVGRAAMKGLIGFAAGGIAFLPWLPSFLHQLAHTGAPWASAAWFTSVGGAVDTWSGAGLPGQLLGIVYWVAVVAAIAGRFEGGRLVLGRPLRPAQILLAVVAFGPLLLGVAVSHVMGSAYADRYSSVGLAPFILLVAYGVGLLPRRARYQILAAAAVCGLLAGVTAITRDRTQAGAVAEVIKAEGRPGDVVVVCPDQLGPGLVRLLPGDRFRAVAYPTLGDAGRVDWTDYEARNDAADPAAFAERVHRLAGEHDVWYAYADGYKTVRYQCSELRSGLQERHGQGQTLVHERSSVLESETLVRFTPRP